MKRIAYLVLAAGLVSASLAAPMARADEDSSDSGPRAEHRHGDKGDRKDWFKKKLGLSDDQVKKLEEARKAHWEAVKPLREQLKTAMRKLHGELEIKASDGDVAAALSGVESARKALRSEGEKFKASMDSMLTPVQRAKMLVMRERMRGRHMMAMGHGRRDGRRCEGGGRGRGWSRGEGRHGGDRDEGSQSEE